MTTTFYNWENYGNITGVYKKLKECIKFNLTKYDAKLFGYVFMPSHIHLLLFIEGKLLTGFMRDFKKYISQKAFKDLSICDNKIWMDGFDRVVIYSDKILLQKLDYIHRNPVKAGLVNSQENWEWSSAKNYLHSHIEDNFIFTEWK